MLPVGSQCPSPCRAIIQYQASMALEVSPETPVLRVPCAVGAHPPYIGAVWPVPAGPNTNFKMSLGHTWTACSVCVIRVYSYIHIISYISRRCKGHQQSCSKRNAHVDYWLTPFNTDKAVSAFHHKHRPVLDGIRLDRSTFTWLEGFHAASFQQGFNGC